MTVLERLLRGDEVKHGRDLILQVIETKRIDDEDHILVVDTRDITWFNKDEINEYRNIKFTDLGQPRTIEDGLKEGDVIERTPEGCAKVLGVCGSVSFISEDSSGESFGPYSIEELKQKGYSLKSSNQSEELVHLTMEEVSEGKGKGVPSHLLRIKE